MLKTETCTKKESKQMKGVPWGDMDGALVGWVGALVGEFDGAREGEDDGAF